MSARSSIDWSPLGLSSDPVPGDVEGIRQASRDFQAVATAIQNQARALRRLNTDSGWESDSGKVFRDGAGDLADAIEKAHGRYEDAATALGTYATSVSDVQSRAADILERARAAQAASTKAHATDLPDEDDPGYDDAEKDQKDAVDAANGDLRAARRDIESLVSDHDGAWQTANRAAVKALSAAIDDDLKDSWWDHVKQTIHEIRGVLNTIKDWLGVIGAIVGAALLIIALFIPGVNALVVLVLVIVSIVIAASTLLIDVALVISGDGSWTDVAFDVVDLALSCIGLKGASAAVRGATTASRVGSTTTELVESVGRSAGGSALRAGFSFSAAESGMVTAMETVSSKLGVRVLDETLLGGLGKLGSVWIAAGTTSAASDQIFIQGLKAGLFPAIAATYGTVRSTQGDIGAGQTVWQSVFDPEGYQRKVTAVTVGSL